jgi:hypothetical protein
MRTLGSLLLVNVGGGCMYRLVERRKEKFKAEIFKKTNQNLYMYILQTQTKLWPVT